jgi:hypothetical protein
LQGLCHIPNGLFLHITQCFKCDHSYAFVS